MKNNIRPQYYLWIAIGLIACGCLLLAAGLFASNAKLDTVRAELSLANTQLAKLSDISEELEILKVQSQTSFQKLDELYPQIANNDAAQAQTAESLRTLSNRLDTIEAPLEANMADIADIQQSLQHARQMARMTEHILKHASPPRGMTSAGITSFTHYNSDVWRETVAEYIAEARRHTDTPLLFIGNLGSIKIDNENDVPVDGIFWQKLRKIDIRNDKKNTLFIYAPALAALEENAFNIDLDTEKDSVFLDGCLTWTQVDSTDNDLQKWRAKDATGDTRYIELSSHAQVKILPACDPRYFLWQDFYIISQIAATDNTGYQARLPVHEPFFGIGASLKLMGPNIQIAKILPGSPASTAGLKEDEIITTVDGVQVSGLPIEEVIKKIRGAKGSILKLGIRDLSDETREVEIERSLVRPRQQNR